MRKNLVERKQTTVNLEVGLVELCTEAGLNLSTICNNALKDALIRITHEGKYDQKS
jgi:hypothetical protein